MSEIAYKKTREKETSEIMNTMHKPFHQIKKIWYSTKSYIIFKQQWSTSFVKKQNPSSILCNDQKEKLVHWILTMKTKGFAVDPPE